jgi:hypothetical protein
VEVKAQLESPTSSSTDLLRIVDCEPWGHNVHASGPGSDLNVSAAQGSHDGTPLALATCSAPLPLPGVTISDAATIVNPGAHVHSWVLLGLGTVSAGHGSQTLFGRRSPGSQ